MKHIFLIGIGGTGLSAIARVLLEKGYRVSGSDRAPSPFIDELRQAGVNIFIGHAAENIRGADVVVRSSAIMDDNPEVQAALAAHIPVYKRSEFLGQLLGEYTTLAVAGTHGKTTTTALLAWVLNTAGYDPSYIIGGVSKNLGNNAHAGKGPYFVIEADEYDGMFLGLHPSWAIITNMEHDHPDCYPTPQLYTRAFKSFVNQVKKEGGILICGDEPNLSVLPASLPHGARHLTYGLDAGNDYSVKQVKVDSNACTFTALFKGQALAEISFPLPGEHNLRNCLAVVAVCHQSGIGLAKVVDAISVFSGTGRRFDITGTWQGVTIIDDYGHHPTEIKATLQAARSRYAQRRIWAVWQPHTYSRTQALADDFTMAFQDADEVLVTEIYAAREPYRDYSSRNLVEQMPNRHKHFSPTLEDAFDYLKSHITRGDVVLVLSAGDAIWITEQLADHLQSLGPHSGVKVTENDD